MKRFVVRSIASAAMVATLALGTPVAAFAGNRASTTTTTTFSSLHAYQNAAHAYRSKLKAINLAFIAAVRVAESKYHSAFAADNRSADRITARAVMRLAIDSATAKRASALTALGKPPVKPHKFHASFH